MKNILLLFLLSVSISFAQSGYVKDWLILGTFPNDDAKTILTKDYLGNESSISPRGGEMVGDKQWMRYHALESSLNFLSTDFNFARKEHCVIYAAFFVQSPNKQQVQLLLGSDDGVAALCNGVMVHSNYVLRGVTLDEDTASITLSAGWNTILLKAANNEGGYGLAARIAGGVGLRMQADNPFPYAGNPTPAAISFGPGMSDSHFEISADNKASFVLTSNVMNTGMEAVKNAELSVSSGTAALSAELIPEISGGDFLRVPLMINIGDILEAGRTNASLKSVLRFDGKEISNPANFNQEILSRFFEPWEFHGWEEARSDSFNSSVTRTFVVPNDLDGIQLQCMVDIGEAWGSVTVNGETKLPRFSGDSGDLELTPRAKAGDTLHISITAKSDKPQWGTILKRTYLRPRHQIIERYLNNVRFAKEIYGKDPGDQRGTMNHLLTLLTNHQLDRSGDALEDIDLKFGSLVPDAKKLTLNFIGNAHIDMAWLWRYTETEDVTKQTFRAALDNLKTFPSFTFSHGQAQSYYWIEKNDPLMFQEIKRYVEQGRWEITGGTWVESDANIPSGEALVRQYLYGKRYFKQKFGVTVKHGWYPDTFGHPGSLPQILAGCGIETYSFYRPWGEERMFWWESPDGSRIFTHRPPDWYGTWTPIADTVYTTAKRTYDKFSVTNSVKFYGVGDHGGGPTRRQINKINELSTLQMYPAVKMSSFDKYYSTLLAEKKDFPVVRGEQNSIFEGCYTSQAMVKQKNREAEALLPTSEMFSSLAMRYGYAYPDSLYGEAWHRVLFNQFHDVLAGSGVHDVYTDAKNWYDEAFGMATTAMNGGLGKIAANIFTNNKNAKSTPVILFNPLNWQRTEPVELAWKLSGKDLQPAVLDEKGKEVPAQVTGRNGDTVKFVFVPRNVPGIGYKTYWIATKNNSKQAVYSELNLENKYYRVDFDPKTGWITRIYDKTEKREIVKPNSPANQLQVQEDDAGMSAWVIGLKGEPKAMDSLVSVKVIEDGAVRKVVRSEYRYGQSSFAQDAILYKELKRIDFKFTADWHERKKMLKIAFPLNLDSAKATFDIPYGTTERAQDGKEVATQKWTDLSDLLRGVSLLNNAKYGCDVKSNVIRLTALRSSFEPDPKADEGHHEFTYALYPHKGTWREAQTVQRGYEFNTPMVTYSTTQHKGTLTASNSLISCSSTDIVIAAVKKCEDDNGLILRCYETTGKPAEAKFQFWQAVKKVSETDMMEWNEHESKNLRLVKNGFTATMKPFEVKTMKLAF